LHLPEWGKFLLIWYLALNRALFKSRIFPGLAATIHSVGFVYFFMIPFLKQRFALVSAICRQYARGLPARLYILSGFFWCMSEHQRLSPKQGTGNRGIGESGNRAIGEFGNRGIRESGNPGIGESDKNFIGFNLIYSIYNLCNKRK
jgi:hypothetical protein